MHRLLIALLLLIVLSPTAFAGGGPAETVVLLNEASEDSARVAEHYVTARGLPPANVCRVRCETGLTTTMDAFIRDVVDPLRAFLRERDLEERCRFVVLTQGMPIRARARGGNVSTCAALTLLDSPVCGMDGARLPRFQNPYTSGVAPTETIVANGRLILATALISSTADEAIALIDRSVASDGTAPRKAHFVFQDANGNANVRNAQYDTARKGLEARGHTSEHVKAGKDEVRGRKRLMGYMSGGAYSKLSVEGVHDNAYPPGAICDMLQSFGAVPENFGPDGTGGKQFPVTHMIRAGVTGVHGAVAEPYAHTFPRTDLFEPYARGFTLAETFHMSLPFRYWMNLVIGDPLCAPYAKRPKPKVSRPARGSVWTGTATLAVAADGAARIDVFIDGRHAGHVDGPRGDVAVDTARHANGARHVLVQATRDDEVNACGWTWFAAEFENDAAAAAPVPAAALGSLSAETPSEVVAGTGLVITPRPESADGTPAEGWTGRLELRSAVPPVRWSRSDDGGEIVLQPTQAGTIRFTLSAPDHGLAHAFEVAVVPGPLHHATTPLSAIPRGQVTDVPVRLEDQFGNAVAGWEGEIRLAVPDDTHAHLPGPVTLTAAAGGRAVLRDVMLTRDGRRGLQFHDGSGRRLSQQGEGATVGPAAIRAWLLGRPGGADTAKGWATGDPGADVTTDGSVSGGTLFRRHRDTDDEIGIANGTGAVVAVALLNVLSDVEVDVCPASRTPVRVLLDGKEVWSGQPKQTNPRKRGDAVTKAKLTKGPHRVTVVVERGKRSGFSLSLAKGKEALPGVVRVVAAHDESPTSFVVSGRVRRPGGRGIGEVTVLVVGPDGTEREARTLGDGTWWVSNAPAGEHTVLVAAGGKVSRAAERTVAVADGHVPDVDFEVADTVAPTVSADSLGPKAKAGKTLRVRPRASDDDAVREVRLLLDGEVAVTDTAAPWDLSADVADRPRGPVTVTLVAVDASGNEGRSEDITVTLVDDRKGPTVTLKGLSRNATLKKAVTVTASVRDPIGLGAVTFTLGGKALPPFDGAGTYAVKLDPAAIGKGRHTLVCVATDTDGNETRKELSFRVK